MTSNISVVFFHDLKHADLEEEGFHGFSYGDAEWTLVAPDAVIDELENRGNKSLQPLIDELEKVPRHILIAFRG